MINQPVSFVQERAKKSGSPFPRSLMRNCTTPNLNLGTKAPSWQLPKLTELSCKREIFGPGQPTLVHGTFTLIRGNRKGRRTQPAMIIPSPSRSVQLPIKLTRDPSRFNMTRLKMAESSSTNYTHGTKNNRLGMKQTDNCTSSTCSLRNKMAEQNTPSNQTLNPHAPAFKPKEYERGCVKISSFNSGSIRHKIHELNNYLQNTMVSILAVSETWLGPSIPDCMVTIPGFQPLYVEIEMRIEEVFVLTFTINFLMSAGMIWKTVNWN